MKKQFRVTSHQEFQEIVHSRHYESNSRFTIYYRFNEYGYPRIGISAPTKLGTAVTRVLVRRQIRGMIDELKAELLSYDYVIVARKGYKTNEYQENKEQLRVLLGKIRRERNEEIA